MAKPSSKVSTFLNLALILSLVLIITIAESRSLHPRPAGNYKKYTMARNHQKKQMNAFTMGTVTKLPCKTVVGVAQGDTCFGIASGYKLSSSAFASLNPNLNCDSLFVGQWVCIDGKSVTYSYRKYH